MFTFTDVFRRAVGALAWLALTITVPLANAQVFTLPPAGQDVIGDIQMTVANAEDTLLDVALRHGIGYNAIRAANPAVDAWLPKAGTRIILPNRYILPAAPREGIVVNAAEMRLYYYPKPKPGQPATVEVYAVSIGRGDWNTPLTTTKVVRKDANPAWYPPKSVRAEHAAEGDILPTVVPPGPNNPLGKYSLRLGLPGYLIHGSNKQFGIGMQVTHGCMRMYAPDIERLYQQVPVGTPVRIVNQPYKAGWSGDTLYLEVHPQLEGRTHTTDEDRRLLETAVNGALRMRPGYPINWGEIEVVQIESSGIPLPVGGVPAAQPAQQTASDWVEDPQWESIY